MIRLQNTTYRYPEGRFALSDVSLSVPRGSCVGIIGANGAGKSTLLKLIAGLFEPTSGCIEVNGTTSNRQNRKAIQAITGLVFQNPDDQLFTASVYDDIAFGPIHQKKSMQDVEKIVSDTLHLLHLDALRDIPPHQLSGGEKKRAAIASVLAMSPEILLLDEPSAFLDPKARRELIQILRDLPHTKFIASHDLDFVRSLCKSVYILQEGALLAEGDCSKLLDDAQLLLSCGL